MFTRTLLALCVCLVATLAAASDDPWDFERPKRELTRRSVVINRTAPETSHPIKLALDSMVNFFQEYLSPLDGPKCPHYPTCSQYSRESISEYGPLWGTLMTANRLTREYGGILESGHYKLVFKGRVRAYDPPEQHWLWGDYLYTYEED